MFVRSISGHLEYVCTQRIERTEELKMWVILLIHDPFRELRSWHKYYEVKMSEWIKATKYLNRSYIHKHHQQG